MTSPRGNCVYYFRRRLPGLGLVSRSLRTKSSQRAESLEQMLVSLGDRGRADLLAAWHDGTLDIRVLWDAYDSGKMGKLTERLESTEMALSKAIAAFLDSRDGTVRDSTLGRYRASLEHAQKLMPETVQEALATPVVDEFRSQRRKTGAAKETVNNDLVALSSLATYCVEMGWLRKRPGFKKFTREARIRYLGAVEIAMYVAALRPAFRVQMKLLLGTGMRLGESERLEASDLRADSGGMHALVHHAKSPAGVRSVFVPGWVAEALHEHTRGPGPLFTIPRRTVQKEHKRACRLVGITRYTIHDHRHTAAVQLAKAGMPLHLLQQQLGHASSTQTMEYARFNPDYTDVARYFETVAANLKAAEVW